MKLDTYCLHDVPFHVAHIKFMFEDEIRHEIRNAGRRNLHLAEQGAVIET